MLYGRLVAFNYTGLNVKTYKRVLKCNSIWPRSSVTYLSETLIRDEKIWKHKRKE